MEAIQLWKSKQRSRDFESGRNNSISHDSGRVITPLLRLCAFSLTHVSSHVFLVFIVPCLYNLLPWGWTVMNFNTEDETTVSLWGCKIAQLEKVGLSSSIWLFFFLERKKSMMIGHILGLPRRAAKELEKLLSIEWTGNPLSTDSQAETHPCSSHVRYTYRLSIW